GRPAGIAADEVEGVHGDIELVAVGVLEHQELALEPTHLESAEPDEAPDTIRLVHDRCTRTKVREVANDLFWIALGPPPASFLPDTFAEQLLFSDDGERRVGQDEPGGDR